MSENNNTNLYHENLKEVLGNAMDYTFKNARIDLYIYFKFLKKVENRINELSVVPIKLNLVEVEELIEDNAQAEKRYIYAPKNSSKEKDLYEEITRLLFDAGVKHIFTTPNRERGEKPTDNRIEIQDRNGQEDLIILHEKIDKKTILYIRQDDYQIKKQLYALMRLRDRPLMEHVPLLQLFENPKFQKLNRLNIEYDTITSDLEGQFQVLTDNRDGSDQQREFVARAIATKDFALLEGPPGSGKTTTIIELIIQLCNLGQRVLLVSATHVAVDNVLKRVLTSYKEACQEKVAPVRIASDKGQIRYEEVQDYRMQELVHTKARAIKAHLNTVKNKSESQQMLFESVNQPGYPRFLEAAILESSNLVCGTMIGILQHPFLREDSIIPPFDVMIVDEASKVTFQEFLVPALYAKKWILVGDVKQLSPYVEQGNVEIALEPLLSPNQKELLTSMFPVCRRNYSFSKNAKRNRLQVYLYNNAQSKEVLKMLPRVEVVHLDVLHRSNSELEMIGLINSSDIVVAQNNIKNRSFLEKHLFVDADIHNGWLNNDFSKVQAFHGNVRREDKRENSWESEVAQRLNQFYAFRSQPELGKHLKRDLDFLLPEGVVVNESRGTTLRDEIERIKQITMPSILELLQQGTGERKRKDGSQIDRILYDGFPKEAEDLKFVSLPYQHRMEDQIAQTSRENFYKENLETANTVYDRDNPLESYRPNEDPVIWVTNNADRKYDKRINRRLNANEWEAGDIMDEIDSFLEWSSNNPPEDSTKEYEVAVLCFYRDQEKLMREKLQRFFRKQQKNKGRLPTKNFKFENVKVVLCTVDRFQGDEADMVLLSFTKGSKHAFYKSPNRLNVALTRARFKLVLFGNRTFFQKRRVSKALTALAEFDLRLNTNSKNN